MYDMPAFREAMVDKALRGAPFRVYWWCFDNLDTREYRFVKQGALYAELELKERVVNRAFRLLVSLGYLDAGPRAGRLMSYRLYHSRSTDMAFPSETPVEVRDARGRWRHVDRRPIQPEMTELATA